MASVHKPQNRQTTGIQRWFQFRLRTLHCIMLFVAIASLLWHPVIWPWLESRRQSDRTADRITDKGSDTTINVDALVKTLSKRINPGIKVIPIRRYGCDDSTAMQAAANQSPNNRHYPGSITDSGARAAVHAGQSGPQDIKGTLSEKAKYRQK